MAEYSLDLQIAPPGTCGEVMHFEIRADGGPVLYEEDWACTLDSHTGAHAVYSATGELLYWLQRRSFDPEPPSRRPHTEPYCWCGLTVHPGG